MRTLLYTVLVEADERGPEHGFSAYCPDVPGVIATGETYEQTLATFREALAFHLEGEEAPPALHRAVTLAVEVEDAAEVAS